MIAEIVMVKVIGQQFSCMYRVSKIYDRVCIDIHDTRSFRVLCTELWWETSGGQGGVGASKI